MLTKRIVVIISKYMEVKPSYHMPETHTVMWVNWISIELGSGVGGGGEDWYSKRVPPPLWARCQRRSWSSLFQELGKSFTCPKSGESQSMESGESNPRAGARTPIYQ